MHRILNMLEVTSRWLITYPTNIARMRWNTLYHIASYAMFLWEHSHVIRIDQTHAFRETALWPKLIPERNHSDSSAEGAGMGIASHLFPNGQTGKAPNALSIMKFNNISSYYHRIWIQITGQHENKDLWPWRDLLLKSVSNNTYWLDFC